MKQLTIKKNNVITHGPSQFSTLEELQAHLATHEAMKTYGTPAHTVPVLVTAEIPAVIQEDGTVLVEATPAVFEEVPVAADYEIIIEDVIDTSAQDSINAEALAYLQSTDYLIIREIDNGVPCPVEVKEARQAARDRIVN